MHCGNHVRSEFEETIYQRERVKPRLISQLWHCSDIMPSTLCQELDMRLGSTYAMAVRQLRRERN